MTDSFLTFVIRSSGDPSSLAAEARQAIWSVASDVPVYEVAPLPDLVAKSVGPRRFMMVLLELFGAVALLMTAIGVYGVIAYSVAERDPRDRHTRGARRVLARHRAPRRRRRHGNRRRRPGRGRGGCRRLTRYLEGSLFSVSATDPSTFGAVAIVLMLVALAAQSVPVIRAMRVDPTVALRAE